jgi:tRNA(fMet)-specific endonuclease VapC
LILDTNALSALADGSSEFAAAMASVDMFSLPVIALGEFRFGLMRSRHRGRYETWLKRLTEASFLLGIDEETTAHYAAIREDLRRKGTPIPSNDTWIAALAVQHGLWVASRDTHFDVVAGIKRQSW